MPPILTSPVPISARCRSGLRFTTAGRDWHATRSLDHGSGTRLLVGCRPGDGAQRSVHLDPLALLLSQVHAPELSRIRRRVGEAFFLGQGLLRTTNRQRQKPSGRCQSLSLQMDQTRFAFVEHDSLMRRSGPPSARSCAANSSRPATNPLTTSRASRARPFPFLIFV